MVQYTQQNAQVQGGGGGGGAPQMDTAGMMMQMAQVYETFRQIGSGIRTRRELKSLMEENPNLEDWDESKLLRGAILSPKLAEMVIKMQGQAREVEKMEMLRENHEYDVQARKERDFNDDVTRHLYAVSELKENERAAYVDALEDAYLDSEDSNKQKIALIIRSAGIEADGSGQKISYSNRNLKAAIQLHAVSDQALRRLEVINERKSRENLAKIEGEVRKEIADISGQDRFMSFLGDVNQTTGNLDMDTAYKMYMSTKFPEDTSAQNAILTGNVGVQTPGWLRPYKDVTVSDFLSNQIERQERVSLQELLAGEQEEAAAAQGAEAQPATEPPAADEEVEVSEEPPEPAKYVGAGRGARATGQRKAPFEMPYVAPQDLRVVQGIQKGLEAEGPTQSRNPRNVREQFEGGESVDVPNPRKLPTIEIPGDTKPNPFAKAAGSVADALVPEAQASIGGRKDPNSGWNFTYDKYSDEEKSYVNDIISTVSDISEEGIAEVMNRTVRTEGFKPQATSTIEGEKPIIGYGYQLPITKADAKEAGIPEEDLESINAGTGTIDKHQATKLAAIKTRDLYSQGKRAVQKKFGINLDETPDLHQQMFMDFAYLAGGSGMANFEEAWSAYKAGDMKKFIAEVKDSEMYRSGQIQRTRFDEWVDLIFKGKARSKVATSA